MKKLKKGKRKSKTLAQMVKALKDYVIKPRSPHKPTKSHKNRAKYTRKRKHKTPLV